jgi:hypothetical protein
MAIEVLYLRNLFSNMGFPEDPHTPVYEDNTACIECGNHVISGRERANRINIRKHFAHEVMQDGAMKLIKVDTADQLADVFTKPLSAVSPSRLHRGHSADHWQEAGLSVVSDSGPGRIRTPTAPGDS